MTLRHPERVEPSPWPRRAERLWAWALNLGLLLAALGVLLPIAWLFTSSLKPNAEIFAGDLRLIPRTFYWQNYANLLAQNPYLRWFWNSFVVSGGATVLGLFVCSLAGYAFAKFEFRGKRPLFGIVVASTTIPMIATIIPVFALMVKIGAINTYWALILPAAVNAFGIFLMRSTITSVPSELLDAARVDGASEFGIYWRVVVPLIKPGLAALGIIIFRSTWESYLWPLIMMRTTDMFTVPLGLSTMFADRYGIDYGIVMAGGFLSIIPILIVFALMQEQFLAGATAGALKG
jgi:ABC-type glycerol-3-phosphate transport system permease component